MPWVGIACQKTPPIGTPFVKMSGSPQQSGMALPRMGWQRSAVGLHTAKGDDMYARTSIWTGTPEALENWVRHVTEKVGPMVAALPDNGGAYFFVDRAGARAFTLTLWKSEGAALKSDETADKSRESTVAATGVELLERGRFEVGGKGWT